MRIPGVVDVYQVGDEWVARSWPKVQNQPNSAAQLLWRKKFKDAHAVIKTWSGTYLDAWRAIKRPPGKMWIDIAMTSIMSGFLWSTEGWDAYNRSYTLYYNPAGFPDIYGEPTCKYILMPYPLGGFFVSPSPARPPRLGSNWDSVLKWNDLGFICSAGKRPKKRWSLSYESQPAAIWPGPRFPFITFGSNWTNIVDAPDGVTVTLIDRFTPIEDDKSFYVMRYPPFYVKPTLWTHW